jgi:hypothetical protein
LGRRLLLAVDRIIIKRAICIPDIDRVYFQLVWCGEVVPDVMMTQLDGPSLGISVLRELLHSKKRIIAFHSYIQCPTDVLYRRYLVVLFSSFSISRRIPPLQKLSEFLVPVQRLSFACNVLYEPTVLHHGFLLIALTIVHIDGTITRVQSHISTLVLTAEDRPRTTKHNKAKYSTSQMTQPRSCRIQR